MKVLVTGGAGFIGSHLVEALVARGDQVAVVDNFITGRFENLDGVRDQLAGIYYGSGHEDSALRSAVAALGSTLHCVYHLAGRLGVARLGDPAYRLNATLEHVGDVDRVANLASHYKARLVMTSSSEVYGTLDAEDAPMREDRTLRISSPTTGWRGAYAASKLTGEYVAQAYAEMGTDIVVARLFNVVGPRQHPDSGQVVPQWVAAAVAREPLQVWTPEAERCFTPIGECVRALMHLGDHGAPQLVVNVGSASQCIRMDALARLVAEQVEHCAAERGGARGERIAAQGVSVVIAPPPAGSGVGWMRVRVPDTSVLDAALGGPLQPNLARAVREQVEWYVQTYLGGW